jgi:hypothetical protein
MSCAIKVFFLLYIFHPSAESQGREARFCDSPNEHMCNLGSPLVCFLTSPSVQVVESSPSHSDYSETRKKLIQQRQLHADNLNTTQTPECAKEKYNAKIKVKGSLLRSHQQPT